MMADFASMIVCRQSESRTLNPAPKAVALRPNALQTYYESVPAILKTVEISTYRKTRRHMLTIRT
jgi:hypothetical protein